MKKIAKTLISQGHGKIGYIFEFTEIEVIALGKHFDGKKLKKGSPLELALYSVRNNLPRLKIEEEKMADLLNPQKRWIEQPKTTSKPSGSKPVSLLGETTQCIIEDGKFIISGTK